MIYSINVPGLVKGPLEIGFNTESTKTLLVFDELNVLLDWQGRQNLVRALFSDQDYICQPGLITRNEDAYLTLLQTAPIDGSHKGKTVGWFTMRKQDAITLAYELQRFLIFELPYKSPADLFFVACMCLQGLEGLRFVDDYSRQFVAETGSIVYPYPATITATINPRSNNGTKYILAAKFEYGQEFPDTRYFYEGFPFEVFKFDWNRKEFKHSKQED